MSKQWGDFPSAWGDEPGKTFTGGELAKAVDKDDIDLTKFCEALDILKNRAPRMNKAQLYRLNYKLGFAVNKFKEEVFKYITRPRETAVNQGTLEKVHKGNGDMDDAGIDGDREIILPETRGAGNKFVKAHTGDMSDSGID